LEDNGLIKARPEGRIRYLELTNRGKKVATALKSLQEALRAPAVLWRKADRLRELADQGDSELRLGPLRRDVSRLKSSGDDELMRAVDEIDKIIVEAIGKPN
jgi:DNA-binding transcriptional ArsR family regulator